MRAPRVIIVGPPGSGRSSVARRLCKTFGLTYVSSKELLKELIHNKDPRGMVI